MEHAQSVFQILRPSDAASQSLLSYDTPKHYTANPRPRTALQSCEPPTTDAFAGRIYRVARNPDSSIHERTSSRGDPKPDAAPPDFPIEYAYEQLRAIAKHWMAGERTGHTLQATALVNEAWIRIADDAAVRGYNRPQFFAAAADAMRKVLIDHARRRGAKKRGGGRLRFGDVLDLASSEKIGEALARDDLILRLEQENADAARVVRLRFYCGLEIAETAAAMEVSERTVKRL